MEQSNKQVLVIGVTSGIAIYKTLDVISKLRDKYDIHVVMTPNALKMVNPITFSTMSRNRVRYDTFEEKDWIAHISLADDADIFAVIPATANCIGKIANGIGDDLLSTVAIAAHCRKIIAPAMNVNMWNNPIVQKNLAVLKENSWEIIEPASGMLACGYEGRGKLADVQDIIAHIIGDKPLKGRKVVVTAGANMEDLDPVRYITNRSTGRMGLSFAKTAKNLGAEVVLIHGHVEEKIQQGIPSISVRSAMDMLEAVKESLADADVLIMSAAVTDYRVNKVSDEKIKKDSNELVLKLIKNPDILKTLKPDKGNRVFVGFALESENLLNNARKKLNEKGVDLLVANSTKAEVSPFGGDSSKVYILDKTGNTEELPVLPKTEIARKVFDRICGLLN